MYHVQITRLPLQAAVILRTVSVTLGSSATKTHADCVRLAAIVLSKTKKHCVLTAVLQRLELRLVWTVNVSLGFMALAIALVVRAIITVQGGRQSSRVPATALH